MYLNERIDIVTLISKYVEWGHSNFNTTIITITTTITTTTNAQVFIIISITLFFIIFIFKHILDIDCH